MEGQAQAQAQRAQAQAQLAQAQARHAHTHTGRCGNTESSKLRLGSAAGRAVPRPLTRTATTERDGRLLSE